MIGQGAFEGLPRILAFLTAVASCVFVLAVPGMARAAPLSEHIHYDVVDSGSFDDCGFLIEFQYTLSDHFLLREVRDSDSQAFLGHDNYDFRNRLTNPSTGAWFLVRGHGLFQHLSGRQVDGDVWEFAAHDVGQPFVVEDSQGNVVLRDRGRVTLREVVDTLGDSRPGGIHVETEITGVHGPHPGFGLDLCALASDLIG